MPFGPGADSVRSMIDLEAVNGKAKASRGDFTASEDDNTLVQGVEQQDRSRLLRLRLLRRAQGQVARRSRSTTARAPASPNSRNAPQRHLYRCRVRCSCMCVTRPPSDRRPPVAQFMLTNGKPWAKSVTCRCRRNAYDLAWKHFQSGKLGTVFGGVPMVGVTIGSNCRRWKRQAQPGIREQAGPGSQGSGPFGVDTERLWGAGLGKVMSATASTRSTAMGRGRSPRCDRKNRDRAIELIRWQAPVVVFTTVAIVSILVVESSASSSTFDEGVSDDTEWTPLFDDAHHGIMPLVSAR